MIDDTLIRRALEGVIGGQFRGLPVSRVGEPIPAKGAHIRTYFVREARAELYHGIRRVKGMLGILVHVPMGDGSDAAEGIAQQIPPLYRPDETRNGSLSAVDGTVIVIREASLMTIYSGVDEGKQDRPWVISPVQIDWRVDLTA